MSASPSLFNPRLPMRRRIGRAFEGMCLLLAVCACGVLGVLIARILYEGGSRLRWDLLTLPPSVLSPETAGVQSALWGTIWLMALTTLFAVPVGVGAAVYLEEYSRRTRLTDLIQLNIANLAGVPSIVYGILGLALFVRWCHFDRSILSGALTLSLLVLPVIIIAAREALAAVPNSIRQAAFALGATRWQTVRSHVLPAALPGIMTGVILAMSRAIGEAAPLIVIGAWSYITTVPGDNISDYPMTAGGMLQYSQDALLSFFTALPIQIFNWADKPQKEFHELSAASSIVLLAILLTMNAVAISIRAWHQRKRTW